jgi:hypothetical protein
MRFALIFSVLLAAPLAACGGNVVVDAAATTTTTGTGAGGATTSSSTTGVGGGCISPTVGEACSSTDVACQPANPCCTGYEWTCMAGTWQQEGLGCACQTTPPFACGTTTCSAGFFCQDQPPGIAPPLDSGVPADTYQCLPLPASCGSTPSCSCLQTAPPQGSCAGVGSMCSEDASGNITIVCLDA